MLAPAQDGCARSCQVNWVTSVRAPEVIRNGTRSQRECTAFLQRFRSRDGTLRMNSPSATPTVVIMARLRPGTNGGVEQAVMGTVAALGRLTDGNERYVIVTDPAAPNWLDSYLGPNSHVVVAPAPEPIRYVRTKNLLGPALPVVRRVRRAAMARHSTSVLAVAPRDPLVEGLGADVVHVPYQSMHQTSAPSIFNPQDLQHLHHPEFFSRDLTEWRGAMWGQWCREATMVEVPSQASKRDLIRLLGIPESKIMVIPKGSPTELLTISEQVLREVRNRYALPEEFAFYPAHTWRHKNHMRLLEGLAALRDDHGLRLHLVCTGGQDAFFLDIRSKIQECNLEDQVSFLGFIPSEHVKALYQLAQFTIFPSLFEGGGFPVLEALTEGSPLACSDLPVLREQANEAALYFDSESIYQIATTLLRMNCDSELRASLRERGKTQAALYSWDRTAHMYRALYRKLSNLELVDEDITLLAQASHWVATDSSDVDEEGSRRAVPIAR